MAQRGCTGGNGISLSPLRERQSRLTFEVLVLCRSLGMGFCREPLNQAASAPSVEEANVPMVKSYLKLAPLKLKPRSLGTGSTRGGTPASRSDAPECGGTCANPCFCWKAAAFTVAEIPKCCNHVLSLPKAVDNPGANVLVFPCQGLECQRLMAPYTP